MPELNISYHSHKYKMPIKEYPEEGEVVLVTVRSIFKQGAFVSLDEYGDKKGLLHLSEISLKWVRNIHDYVKEGQKSVLQVLKVNPERGHIDLSLRRVKEQQRKEKLKEVKQTQRANKFLEQLAKELKEPEKKVKDSISEKLLEKYESVYKALETIAGDEKILDSLAIEKSWKPTFLNLVKRNIKAPFVEIVGYVELKSYEPTGVSLVKEALKKIETYKSEGEIEVTYVSAPMYRIKVKATDYKNAERILKNATDESIAYIKQQHGEADFHRELKET